MMGTEELQGNVEFAQRGPGGEFQSVQHYFNTRHTELAKLMDEVPALTPLVRDLVEAVVRTFEDNNIDIRKLKPTVGFYQGRIMIDLGIRGLV